MLFLTKQFIFKIIDKRAILIIDFFKYVLSKIFELIVSIRHFLYDRELIKSKKFNYTKIISIGNISVGGTGKTPHVIKAVKDLKEYKIAVLSRGYKKKVDGEVIVYDKKRFSTAEDGGDEPYMIAKKSGVFTVSNPNRSQSLGGVLKKYSPDFIILDDGFQHRKVKRDIDIVLVDSIRFLGNKKFIPYGILRDSIERLKYSDTIILTKVSRRDKKVDKQIEILKEYNTNIVYSKIVADRITNGKDEIDISTIDKKRVLLFTGIALRKPFLDLFSKSEKESLIFSDHHRFSDSDIKKIYYCGSGKDYIICTEKDYVNLPKNINNKIYFLKMDVELFDLEDKKTNFRDIIDRWTRR